MESNYNQRNHNIKIDVKPKVYTMTLILVLLYTNCKLTQPVLAFSPSTCVGGGVIQQQIEEKQTFSAFQRLKPLRALEFLSGMGGSPPIYPTDIVTYTGMAAIPSALNSFFESQPYLASFLTCSVKASTADYIAQRQGDSIEDYDTLKQANSNSDFRADLDVSRNVGFLLYGGLYTGIAQNFLYTVLFPRWFGTEESWSTILCQVLVDNLIFGPLVCLPIAYAFKTAFTGNEGLTQYTLHEGLKRYGDDILERGLLTKYWSLWIPVQFMTFSVIPSHFRVVFVATVSFFWFFILSTISTAEGVPSEKEKSNQ